LSLHSSLIFHRRKVVAIRFVGQNSNWEEKERRAMAKIARKKAKPARRAKMKRTTSKRSGAARRKSVKRARPVARRAKARRKAA